MRKRKLAGSDIPYGYCQCGCGRRTSLSRWTSPKDGYLRGEPYFYLRGHSGRIRQQYIVDPNTNCWIWQGAQTAAGYGTYSLTNSTAHRYYYETYVGPIPPGFDVHHLCGNRICVNPAHLEAVTKAQNQFYRRMQPTPNHLRIIAAVLRSMPVHDEPRR